LIDFFDGYSPFKKPPSPSPLKNQRGEGKAKAGVLGVRVRKLSKT
jgi:hypothetical protein